jgi:hypothetical protein
VHGNLLRWLSSYIDNRTQAVALNNCVSQFRRCPSGVPQGSHLGPILFILYINDIKTCFRHSRFLVYADDIKIFAEVASERDAMNMQTDLNRLHLYCSANELYINVSKCCSISFTRSRSPLNFDYSIDQQFLKRCSLVKDLGVTLDAKMTFKAHTDNIVGNALGKLGYIMRISKPFKSTDTLKVLFFTYIRTCLEYASVVWNPQYVTYIDRLERVQNKFLKQLDYRCRVVFDDRSRSAHYHRVSSLEGRRTTTDLLYLYKIVNGLVDSESLVTGLSFNCPLRPTRSPHTFRLPVCRTNYAQNSFFQRACGNYNVFYGSVDIFQHSIRAFKTKILRAPHGS